MRISYIFKSEVFSKEVNMVVKNTEFYSTKLFLKNAPKNSYTQKKHVFLRTFTVVFLQKQFFWIAFFGVNFLIIPSDLKSA